jgi:hypothetical protein
MFVRRSCAVILAVMLSNRTVTSQQNAPQQGASPTSTILTPDSGLSEPGVYTNNFFGMSYSYPSDWKIQHKLKQRADAEKVYSLLFVTLPAKHPEFTALAITARAASPPSLTAEEYIAKENLSRDVKPLQPPQHLLLGGIDFLRFDSEQKKSSNRIAELVSIQKGYVLQFFFVGATKARVKEFDRTLDTIRFSPH